SAQRMSLGDKISGFALSAVESIPELFGIEPSEATQRFRAVAPVSGIVSQIAGAFVPYMGAARALGAVPGAARVVAGARAVAGPGRPIMGGALALGTEAAMLEVGRVGLGVTPVPEVVYESLTGRNAETRSAQSLV